MGLIKLNRTFFSIARPDPTDPEQKLLSQRGLADGVFGGKKRRECYVGNLAHNKAPCQIDALYGWNVVDVCSNKSRATAADT